MMMMLTLTSMKRPEERHSVCWYEMNKNRGPATQELDKAFRCRENNMLFYSVFVAATCTVQNCKPLPSCFDDVDIG